MIILGAGQFRKGLEEIYENLLSRFHSEVKSSLDQIDNRSNLEVRVKTLREEVEKLTIEKERKVEEYNRKDREIEHKIGLERKRQEEELRIKLLEMNVNLHAEKIKIREDNLNQERRMFEDKMKDNQDSFEREIKMQRELLTETLKRLPKVEWKINEDKA